MSRIVVVYNDRPNCWKGYLVDSNGLKLDDNDIGRSVVITSRGSGNALATIVSVEELKTYKGAETIYHGNEIIIVVINRKDELKKKLIQTNSDIEDLNYEFNKYWSALAILKVDNKRIDEIKNQLQTLVEKRENLITELKKEGL